MLTRLQMETRALHPEADSPWVELMSFDTSIDRYAETLVAAYGFEAPNESAIAMTPGVDRVLDVRRRLRSGYIVQDLLALGYSPSRIARLPQCCSIEPFRNVAEALGWLYVVERATLLHDSVRRHLQARLPRLSGALNYLSAYQGVAGERWQELGHALDVVATSPEISEQITSAARDAFRTLHDWLASDEAHSERGGASSLS